MTKTRINEKGFSHYLILAVVVVVAIGAVGVHVLSKSHADAVGNIGLSKASTRANDATGNVNEWGLIFATPSDKYVYPNSPSPISGLSNVTDIQAGNSDSYAIANGNDYGWGFGVDGELGNGGTANSFTTPVEVQFPAGTPSITAIGESFNNGYAIDANGHGWAWGNNRKSSVCAGVKKNQLLPDAVTGLPTTVSAVGGGESHVLWLGTNGDVYACGAQPFGQLGDNSTKTAKTPVQVQGLPAGDPVVAISAGDNFSAALTKSGKLFTWGANTYGQLGIGNTTTQYLPVQVPGTFSQMFLGGGSGDNTKGQVTGANSSHVIAITTSGTVEAWGNDAYGQLGDGQTTNEDSPVAVQVPSGVTFVKIMAAGVSSGAIDSNGNVWTWGANGAGTLGNGSSTGQSTTPIEVDSGRSMISGTASNILDY